MSADAFAGLGLGAALARACAAAGFQAPSPIQAEAIPPLLHGRDLLGLAPTGSGKTAAYVLPLLHRLAAGPQRAFRRVRVLVLVPTRELAQQVGEVFRRFGAVLPQPPKVMVLHGGVSVNPQMMAMRGGADVVVATPGRLLDLMARNAVRLDVVEALVLDEADRLLDLGFAAEREQVLAALPPRRQNLLFTATFPPEVQALADALLRDAVRVELVGLPLAAGAADAPLPQGTAHVRSATERTPQAQGLAGEGAAAPGDAEGGAASLPEQAADTPGGGQAAIAQRAIAVDAARRTELLRHLAREGGWRRVLVFVATRHACEHVAAKLNSRGLRAAPLHGELSQSARTQALADFRRGDIDMLLTTDLAARGIDIPGLEVVVNYDLPRSPADHVHRIGRTGRAGAHGLAISFVTPATEAHWRLIQKRQDLALPPAQVPGFEPTEPAPPPPPGAAGAGGIKGRRPSKKDKLRAAALQAGGSTPGDAAASPDRTADQD